MLTEGWLSISDTTLGFAYLPRSVAHVCRKSWKRICCGPACPRLRPCPLRRRTQSADVALLPGSLPLWKVARQEMRCQPLPDLRGPYAVRSFAQRGEDKPRDGPYP